MKQMIKAAEIDNSTRSPELVLFAAVLERAFLDYFYQEPSRYKDSIKEDAFEWIMSEDATNWAALANMEGVLSKIRVMFVRHKSGELRDEEIRYNKRCIREPVKYVIQRPTRRRVRFVPKTRAGY